MNRSLVHILFPGQGGHVRSATELRGQAPRGQPRPEPQQARSRDKLSRILAATAELLNELPYDELGTRLIAERAGVSVGSLYRFFPDKDSIARALLLGWLDDTVAIFDRAAGDGRPDQPSALIEQLVDSYADFFRQEPGFRNAFFHAQRNPALEEAQRNNDHDLAARLCEVLRTGYGISAPGLEARCLIAVQVCDYLLGLAFRDRADGDPRVLDEAKLLLCRYLRV
jgi:AcrR family transcriptional regulator